jgi:hypothetical protein
MDGENPEQVCAVSDIVDGKSYNLNRSYIAEELELDELSSGSYRYELAAVVGNYYYENHQLNAQWETVSLWNSDFRVTPKKHTGVVVTFESLNSELSLNSRALIAGESIGKMPTAARSEYIFRGWFTQPYGGEQISEDFVPTENMIVYPQWSSTQALRDSLSSAEGCWYVYVDGLTTMGCAQLGGTMYYFTNPDTLGHGGLIWTTAH